MTMKETKKNSTCQYRSWQKQQQQRDILQKGQYCSPNDEEGHLAEGLLYLAEGLLYLAEGLYTLKKDFCTLQRDFIPCRRTLYLAEGGPENGDPIKVLLLGLETPGDPEVLLSV